MSHKFGIAPRRADDRERTSSLNPTWLLGLGGAAAMLEGCRLVGDIFKAGVWVGVIGIVLFVALFVGLVRFLMG